MIGARNTFLKNAGVMMAAQIITWSLSLVLAAILPRYLGVTSVGKYQLALSLWGITGVVIGFGMDTLLTKEIARAPAKLNDLFGISLIVRAAFYIIGFAILAIYARIIGFPQETTTILYIIGFSTLFGQFSSSTRATLQGLERMEFISLADIVSKVLITISSILLLLMGYGVVFIAGLVVLASAVSFGIQYYFLNKLPAFRLRFDWQNIPWMLKNSLPYLLSNIFLVGYLQIDVVLISLFVSEDGVGWYSTASVLFSTLLFIPTVFLTAVFPILSRTYEENPNSMPNIISKSFKFLFVLSIPIGFGLICIADPFVILLYGPEFTNSGPILAIFGVVLILMYQNMLLSQFLVSINRQKALVVIMAIATFLSIPLDMILIPWCESLFNNGAMGGALAFVITEAGMVIVSLYLLPRGWLGRTNLWLVAKGTLAGLGMISAVWWWRDAFIIFPIILGASTYFTLIWILRVIPKEDWGLIKEVANTFISRLHKGKPKLTSSRG